MVDIRKIVKEDRGLLKRFQAFLPGYKKYRNCEDLRSADSILRNELSRELEKVKENIKEARGEATRKMDLDHIGQIGELVNLSHKITEKVRHAEQGYAPWISGDVRIEEDELQKLYDFDLSLFEWMTRLQKATSLMVTSFQDGDPEKKNVMRNASSLLNEFEEIFDERISKVTDVAQEKR